VVTALENNQSFRVARYDPALAREVEEALRADFDPILGATATLSWNRTEPDDIARNSAEVNLTATKRFMTGGTLTAEIDQSRSHPADLYATRAGISATQALLRGMGPDVTLADLREAGIDTEISAWEVRGAAESLAASVSAAYWDHALALRRAEIAAQSLDLARRLLKETEDFISVGRTAEIERIVSEAEVAVRLQDEVDARSGVSSTRLALLGLLRLSGETPWDRRVELIDVPALPAAGADAVEDHVALGIARRRDLNQARFELARGEIEIVRTRNGLLPRLDLFVTLGKTGYADSFGGSVEDLDGNGYDASAGLTGEWPLGNRRAKAEHRRAVLGRDRTAEAVENLVRLAELDVRQAHLETQRLRGRIDATRATLLLQEEKLRAEEEKFRVGKSTNLAVAQVQRDLTQSRIDEAQAVTDYLKALTDLYRLDGSLLERYGIRAPGAL
jgi:outer membrane protein TolC